MDGQRGRDRDEMNSSDGEIDIQGMIRFTNDTDYWQANSFRLIFQNATTFWQIGGVDVNIYGTVLSLSFLLPCPPQFHLSSIHISFLTPPGGGTIDGQGQAWYDLYASNIYTLRPILMGIVDLHNASISNLVLRYSPQYYHFVTNSSNVIFDGIDIAGGSRSKNVAKNTDGWDTYRVRDVVIQNSVVNNGDGEFCPSGSFSQRNEKREKGEGEKRDGGRDLILMIIIDCVSFKPNSTNVLVQNMFCNGSHGISVGSLGQYKGEFDIVENIYVYNTSLHNATVRYESSVKEFLSKLSSTFYA
jgi:galacturan 1,4-alpha-galacturonidase